MIDYQVLYIDKFSDPAKSNKTLEDMAHLIHLTSDIRRQLVSGQPVVITQNVEEAVAKRYQQAILLAGGTSWIQPHHNNGYCERRHQARRRGTDRRGIRRSATAKSDRRLYDRRQAIIR